jgi:hypothetical protein
MEVNMTKHKKRTSLHENWERFEPSVLEETDSVESALIRGAWVNNLYEVKIYEGPIIPGWPPTLMLSIGRRDRTAIHDWRHFQRIKNELVGPEHEAVELYPKESRLMDTGNRYWLFALAVEGEEFPFGVQKRVVLGPNPAGSQRPFDPTSPPSNTVSFEQWKQLTSASEEPRYSEPKQLAHRNVGKFRARLLLSMAQFLSDEKNLKRVILLFGVAFFLMCGALLLALLLRQ